jgi:hypothetical protein
MRQAGKETSCRLSAEQPQRTRGLRRTATKDITAKCEGCAPGGAKCRCFGMGRLQITSKDPRASLGRTAEGGCPYTVCRVVALRGFSLVGKS